METLVQFLSSKIFLVFVLLVVAFNIVRRYARSAQRREVQARRRLKERIRRRTAWEDEEQT